MGVARPPRVARANWPNFGISAALQEFLKLTFTEVTVSSYQVGEPAENVPLDEVSLSFSKVQIDYRPQNANGSLGALVHAGWDLEQNKQL